MFGNDRSLRHDGHAGHILRVCGAAILLTLGMVVTAPGAAPAVDAAPAADAGTVDFSYNGTSAPTGQKPQSKLWFVDGIWWGSLYNSAASDFHIYRFDWAGNRWSDTGVLAEPRANASMDTLWDGTHLYIASAGTNPRDAGSSPELRRYSYNAATKTWSADAGYPVRISTGGVEAVVIAKDSRGVLWATFTLDSTVYITHSIGQDNIWVEKYELPTPDTESAVDADDISTVVAYDGKRVGVLWSNQRTEKMYFASHLDTDGDQNWSVDVAYDRPEGADDHMNLKSLQADSAGRVFAVVKTSMNGSNDPLINVIALGLNGSWSTHVFGTVAQDHTRAIVLIDETRRELYVFASSPCCSGGSIYYKKAPLNNLAFAPGLGTPFISSAANPKVNNPTSTKQNLSRATGLLVLAGDDSTHRYLHNTFTLASPPLDTTPPDTTLGNTTPPDTADDRADDLRGTR